MNGDFCNGILRALRDVPMTDNERARAEHRVRKSVGLVEWVLALTAPRGNANPPKEAA